MSSCTHSSSPAQGYVLYLFTYTLTFALKCLVSFEMFALILVVWIFVLISPLHAVPVTSTTNIVTDTGVYDAVVLGTGGIVELMPAPVGTLFPSVVSTLTNADTVSCATGKVCIETVFTDSAGHVSPTIATFDEMPASIVSAIEGIIEAIDIGIAAGKTTSGVVAINSSASSNSIPTKQKESSGSAFASSISFTNSAGHASPTNATSNDIPVSIVSVIESITRTIGGGTAAAQIISGVSGISSTTPSSSTPTKQRGNSRGASGSSGSLTQPFVSSGSASVGSVVLMPVSTPSIPTTGSLMTRISASTNSTSFVHSTTTDSLQTGTVKYALNATNSQGPVTGEAVGIAASSSTPSTNPSSTYVDSITTTEASIPLGVSIQTFTTSTCTTEGAITTTTRSRSTVATEVPKLCTHGLGFLIFGLPLDLPSICHTLFAFLPGILWRVRCPDHGPPIISIVSVDPDDLPSGGKPPDENPTDSNETKQPSQTSQAQTSGQTSFTTSSSAATTPTRYVVMPLFDTSQSAIDSIFAPYISRSNVTQAKNIDGSLDFFALELNDAEASTMDANPDFIIIQETELDISEPDSEYPL